MSGNLERVTVQREGRVLRFERTLRASPEKIFGALTKSDRLAEWLAKPDGSIREGSEVQLTFENSGNVVSARVTRFDPPNLLEFAWADQIEPQNPPAAARRAGGNGSCGGQNFRESRIRFDLRRDGDRTLLRLTHTLPAPARGVPRIKLPLALAGWQTHLDALTDSLSGGQVRARRGTGWPWDRFEDLRDRYSQSL